MLILCNTYST